LSIVDAVVKGYRSPKDAWQTLVNQGLVPPTWLDDPKRRFRHLAQDLCESCRGYGECYAGCMSGYYTTETWEPFPATVPQCAAYAEKHKAMARYESLAIDLVARTAPWRKTKTDEHPVARWSIFNSPHRAQVPELLDLVWRALRAAVPDEKLPELSAVRATPDWPALGDRAWKAAVSRGLHVPKPEWGDEAAVGIAFADLLNPFATGPALEELPFHVFAVDASTIELWAHDPRGTG
jgi:hypothetical protein